MTSPSAFIWQNLHAPPAEQLEGAVLDDGWVVHDRILPAAGRTPGHFSCTYWVEHPTHGRAFMKALDFTVHMQGADTAGAILAMSQLFVFERDLLDRCRTMSRVVTYIGCGELTAMPPEGMPPLLSAKVLYLIFEPGVGDMRHAIDSPEPTYGVVLRLCHQVAVGLAQLHTARIAHQDLKPANVIVFGDGSRIGDLGCADDRDGVSPTSWADIPGDRRWAPPEQCYGVIDADWVNRRQLSDLYQLGSIVVAGFTQTGMTQHLLLGLDPRMHPPFSGTYAEVLPYLMARFTEIVEELRNDPLLHHAAKHDVVTLVRELCVPDPALRARAGPGSPIRGARHYVTILDRAARRCGA